MPGAANVFSIKIFHFNTHTRKELNIHEIQIRTIFFCEIKVCFCAQSQAAPA